MTGRTFGVALCLSYLAGLLLSVGLGSLTVGSVNLSYGSIIGACGLILWPLCVPHRWRLGGRWYRWGSLGIVLLLATVYISMRSPVAGPQDISHYVARAQAIAPNHVIAGRLIDEPRLNRALKGRFRVAVDRLRVLDAEGALTFEVPVYGRVYVTAPLLQVTGLHAGQLVKARGRLYLPQSALNPNGFDFQGYLRQRGTFAGFVAEELRFREATGWGLWQLRQRIVRSHVRALGSPLGQLVSAMSLGRTAVDLPSDLQDLFARVGLAHTIAASGFHVSLLLGTVLALVRSRSDRLKFILGVIVLVSYITLTGLQASVIRAALMGAATLAGLITNRKVMPTGALLVAVTLMLLVNPHWIWNIGFQLSVVATWGLIVTAPAITRRLDWLPVTIAALVAVPVAATLWTMPLVLYHFNVFPGLSVLLNIVATPLVTLLSLGGIASSAVAIGLPILGSWMSQLLYFPALFLLWLARMSSQLPGSAIAIGQITLWQLFGLYAVLFLSLGKQRYRKAIVQLLLPVFFLALLLVPMGWQWLTQEQITVLAAGNHPVWVRQHHGQTTLVNSGDHNTAFYTVAPFLTQAGVSHVDHAIALPFTTDFQSGWQTLLPQVSSRHLHGTVPIKANAATPYTFHSLSAGKSQSINHLTLKLLNAEAPILSIVEQQTWLILPKLTPDAQDQLLQVNEPLKSDVLVWAGEEIPAKLLARIQPTVVICYGYELPEFVERSLQRAEIRVFWTHRDGAVTWQKGSGFHGYLETQHRNAFPWG